nr:putative ribonuclease H-like domain-containing protein [Tanacetum cinerariifolium]
MCDKNNKVLFTDTYCLVLSPDFKLPDKNQVLFKIPRQHNMYSFNLKNINPFGDLACLFAKATIDESNKWHRRLGHVNFKNLNKLVKKNLVRGLPSKIFKNDHTCVACQKGKQHKASCKAKTNASTSSTNLINTASTPLSTAGPSRAFNDGELSYPDPSKYALSDDPSMPHLEDIYASPSEWIFTDSSYDDEGVNSEAHALVSYIQKQQRNNHKDFQHCLFACFLSQTEPKKISQALEDESWIDALQEELLQFKIQK